MPLNVKALSITAGIFTAAAILIVGCVNLVWIEYGDPFLKMMASIYPGYDASGTIGDLIVGALYGLIDGYVCGWLFGWLYNRISAMSTGGQEPLQTTGS